MPNGEADRRALIRRAYFGLWGLPPAPADVEAFVNDKEPNAYERMLDRLLAGQHYGERWARHWLDLARFAESNGYAFDKDRPAAYHFRDFVIKAFNQDMSYYDFVRFQVAGDQLKPNDFMAQAATGFLAAGPFTSQQTQKERERSRYEQLDDIVGTLGTSMLGLTVGCARCHDHKFDPLPTRDYYRLVACFSETGFQDFDYNSDPEGTKAALAKFNAAHKPLTEALAKYEKEQLPGRLAAWLKARPNQGPAAKLSPWSTIGPFSGGDFKKAYDTAFEPEKKVDLSKSYGKLKWTPQPAWKDDQIYNTLKGDNSANYLYRTIEVKAAGPLKISLGRDDAVKAWLNGKQVLAKQVTGGVAKDQDIVTLQLQAGKNEFLLKIVNASGPSGFYFSTKPGIPKNISDILKVAEDKRNAKQKQTLLKWYGPRDPSWVKLSKAVQDHQKKQPKPKIIKVFAARRNGVTYNFGADTRKVYFLARGNSNSKQGLASPGFLRVLARDDQPAGHWTTVTPKTGPPTKKHPRVALADWLVDTSDGAGHLLARVIVNRIWQHHLGRGIVGTPSDFGQQGLRPTHPQLLDYLAGELIRGGWRLKRIHKMIMMSAVYRQSGVDNKTGAKVDPDNLLMWRKRSIRMDAEIVRDTLLSVSGTLNRQMFGKGSLDQASPRRSVYLTVKRSNLIPILQLFDAPDAIQGIGHREITTVPPQALAMMNSAFVRQLATKFAKRIRPEPTVELDQVVDQAYRIALSRPPTKDEKANMVTFINTQAKTYGDSKAAQQLAVTDFCQILLCLNEFIFVD